MSAISIRVSPVPPGGADRYLVESEAMLVDPPAWADARGCAVLTRDLTKQLPRLLAELGILRVAVG